MSKTLVATYTQSPFSRYAFDIFNYDHQALIPETIALLKAGVAELIEPMRNNAKIFGKFSAKMVQDKDSDFSEPIFDIELQLYEDQRAQMFLIRDLSDLQTRVSEYNYDEMLDKASDAISIMEETVYPLNFESDNTGSGIVETISDKKECARGHITSQLELWLSYHIKLSIAKDTQIAKFLVDNNHAHLWERRTYEYEDSNEPGVPILKVHPLLVINDPKVAVLAKLYL